MLTFWRLLSWNGRSCRGSQGKLSAIKFHGAFYFLSDYNVLSFLLIHPILTSGCTSVCTPSLQGGSHWAPGNFVGEYENAHCKDRGSMRRTQCILVFSNLHRIVCVRWTLCKWMRCDAVVCWRVAFATSSQPAWPASSFRRLGSELGSKLGSQPRPTLRLHRCRGGHPLFTIRAPEGCR